MSFIYGTRYLGHDVVHVIVGAEEADFLIAKGLVCHYSPYFKAAFTSGFEESASGTIELPDTPFGVFRLFDDWLYSQRVYYKKDKRETWPDIFVLCQLYIFADMVCVPALMNHAIEALYTICDAGRMLLTGRELRYIWQYTTEGSKLRQYLFDEIIWHTKEDTYVDFPEFHKELQQEVTETLRSFETWRNNRLDDVKNYYVNESKANV